MENTLAQVDDYVAKNLTWIEVATTFGPHIPLLLPLVLAAVVTSRWMHQVGLAHFNKQESLVEFSRPSSLYVLFSAACQVGYDRSLE